MLLRTVNGRYCLGWYLFPVGQIVYKTAEFRAEARTICERIIPLPLDIEFGNDLSQRGIRAQKLIADWKRYRLAGLSAVVRLERGFDLPIQ